MYMNIYIYKYKYMDLSERERDSRGNRKSAGINGPPILISS